MTQQPRYFPNFFAVGPQRTATTWLYERLLHHTDLPLGVKETLFFDKHYAKGAHWYLSHFKVAANRLRGEVAPTYFHSEAARARIAQLAPKAKIICSLREPVARLYSLYKLMREYGMTKLSFEDALAAHPEMKESSRYAYHVQRWQETFGRENVLVVFYEELRSGPGDYLTAVTNFLGIPPIPLLSEEHKTREIEAPARFHSIAAFGQWGADWLRSHRLYAPLNLAKSLGIKALFFGGGSPLPAMDPATEELLRREFSAEVTALEELLQRKLTFWHQPIASSPSFAAA